MADTIERPDAGLGGFVSYARAMRHRRQSRVTPTHHELIEVEKELETARKGEHILERQRDGLVLILLDLLDRWRTLRAQVETEFAEASRLHTLGAEREGEISLRELAEARSVHPELVTCRRKLLGVEIPLVLGGYISTSIDQRGYGLLGSSALDDEIVDSYERLLESVVRFAEVRAVIQHLLPKIRQLRLRTNFIQHRLIPELESEKRYIEFYLAEREREERFRQHWLKGRSERRDG